MLRLEVEHLGNVVIFHVNGTLYLDSINYVESAWVEQLSKKPRVIAIDCKNLDQVDSTAIGTLVKFFNHAMNLEIHLIFLDLNKTIMKLFETAKLNRFFNVTTKQNFENSYLLDKSEINTTGSII